LDDIALSYIMLAESGMMGVNYLLLVSGGALGWMTWRGEWRLRRVTYFLALATALLVMALSQTIWLELPAAIKSGQLPLLALAGMGIMLAGGYLTWILAAARSRDIGGDLWTAPLAFIPLANLYLLFRKGEFYPARPRGIGRRLADGVLDVVLVIFGVLVLGAGNGVMKALEDSMESSVSRDMPEVDELAAQLGPRAMVRLMANDLRSQLPLRVDDVTEIVGVDAEGDALVYDYRVDADLDTLPPGFADGLTAQTCGAVAAVLSACPETS
jgi:hypothetical protein